MSVVPASMASRAESRAASAVHTSFSGRRSISSVSQPENVPPGGASLVRKPRWAWALTAPGIMVEPAKERTGASGFSCRTSASGPTAATLPSSTRTAPSGIGGAETGIKVPAAKMPFSGIPSDHLSGHGLQKVPLRAVGEKVEVAHGALDLAPRPLLRPGDGVGGEDGLYAGLQQLRRGCGVG